MTQRKDDDPKGARGQDQIEANLKKVYGDVLTEPLPDKFTDLLNRLKSGEKPDDK
jgi:Anti-sigma factor NepR